MNSKKKLIIAGSFWEAKEYAEHHNLDPYSWFWTNEEKKAKDYNLQDAIFTGNYQENPLAKLK